MAISRKDAIRRLEGLTHQIWQHLAKIAQEPESLAVNHWRAEVRGFIAQMDELSRHVGKGTGRYYRALTDLLESELGELRDDEE